ncbi:MAG TPA: hypothetical protein VFK92_03465 [Burkholderiales bacterium]|nr:hypothetical protein [Burkholderiales bacterium]
MEKSGVISEYAERLARELAFDRSLSRRVRHEVEDHLWESVAANPAGDRLDAERHAVANFGDPRVIAAQFAVASLAKQARRVGVTAILVIAAVFIAMGARLTWYGVMEFPALGQFRALGGLALSIDHFAFWLSVLVGIAGWMYIDSRRIPATFTDEYRTQLRRFFLLSSAATGALIASVVSDGVLTSFRLLEAGWSVEFLVPVLSMAIEIACAAVLVAYIRAMIRRTASTGRTARTG